MTPSGQTLDGLKSLRQSQQPTRLLSSETPLKLWWSVGSLRHGLKALLTYPSAANMANATENSSLGPTSITLAFWFSGYAGSLLTIIKAFGLPPSEYPLCDDSRCTIFFVYFSISISSRLPPNLAPLSQLLPEFYILSSLPAASHGLTILLALRSSSASGLPHRFGWKVGVRQSLGRLSQPAQYPLCSQWSASWCPPSYPSVSHHPAVSCYARLFVRSWSHSSTSSSFAFVGHLV